MSAQSFTRRLFLRRGTVAAAATAVVAVPTIVGAMANDNPALIDLGERLPAVLTRYDEATSRKAEARTLYERLCPSVPAELRVYAGHRPSDVSCERVCDIEGKVVWGPTPGFTVETPSFYLASWNLEDAIPRTDGRTVRGRWLRNARKIAHRYEQAKEDARELSGWADADTDQYYARRDVRDMAEEAFAIPAESVLGLQVKARFLIALERARDSDRNWFPSNYGEKLAPEIIAVLGEEAGR